MSCWWRMGHVWYFFLFVSSFRTPLHWSIVTLMISTLETLLLYCMIILKFWVTQFLQFEEWVVSQMSTLTLSRQLLQWKLLMMRNIFEVTYDTCFNCWGSCDPRMCPLCVMLCQYSYLLSLYDDENSSLWTESIMLNLKPEGDNLITEKYWVNVHNHRH